MQVLKQYYLVVYLTCVCVCEPACGPVMAVWRAGLAHILRVDKRLAPTARHKSVDPTLFYGQGAAASGRHLLSNSQCRGEGQNSHQTADLCPNPPEEDGEQVIPDMFRVKLLGLCSCSLSSAGRLVEEERNRGVDYSLLQMHINIISDITMLC